MRQVLWNVRTACLAAVAAAVAALSGCAKQDANTYQGYVEGEFVYVASPVGGRLDHLGVQRGQTVSTGAPLFVLESVDETAARQQAAAQFLALLLGLGGLQTRGFRMKRGRLV